MTTNDKNTTRAIDTPKHIPEDPIVLLRQNTARCLFATVYDNPDLPYADALIHQETTEALFEQILEPLTRACRRAQTINDILLTPRVDQRNPTGLQLEMLQKFDDYVCFWLRSTLEGTHPDTAKITGGEPCKNYFAFVVDDALGENPMQITIQRMSEGAKTAEFVVRDLRAKLGLTTQNQSLEDAVDALLAKVTP